MSINKLLTKPKANENQIIQEEKSKQVKEMDEYYNIISEMLQYLKENKNPENKEVNSENKEKSDTLNKSVRQKSINQKVSQNEGGENKHYFQYVIQRTTDIAEKKKIFVLTDNIIDDEPDNNKRVQILLDKLIDDKTLVIDKTFSNSFTDLLTTHVYIALSPDSKKLILGKYL